MNYIKSVVSDVKLKYRAGRIVFNCVAKREQPGFSQHLVECVSMADQHPELVLTTLHQYISFRQPENAYGGLLLLEQLVSLCNYGFHLALARDYEIQDRIIQLAVKRGEGEERRKAQRLARLTLLEYSRVFVDDRELLRLSSLASSFEHRTGKSLLRCINMQNRRVLFRDVDKGDIIPISPKESLGSTSGGTSRALRPLRLSSAPEVWPCHVCTYLNAPSATRCAACETLRSTDSVAHRSTTQVTLKTTPDSAQQASAAPATLEIPSSAFPESGTEGHKMKETATERARPPIAGMFKDPMHTFKQEEKASHMKNFNQALEASVHSSHALDGGKGNHHKEVAHSASHGRRGQGEAEKRASSSTAACLAGANLKEVTETVPLEGAMGNLAQRPSH